MPEVAIDHAQAAGEADTVARLVLQLANPVWASGRSDTVLRWMEWFETNNLIERFPAIAVHGALMYALTGRPGDTERWADAAEATVDNRNARRRQHDGGHGGLPPDGLVSRWARGDARDARIAWRDSSAASPYRATMLHAEGVAHLLEGDPDRADTIFARAVDAATAPVPTFIPVVLAERGIAAIERDDWTAAGGFADQALAIMRGRPVRRVLDERPGVRVGGPSRPAPGGPGGGTTARRPSRPAAAVAQLCAPGRIGPGAARDGAGLHRAR